MVVQMSLLIAETQGLEHMPHQIQAAILDDLPRRNAVRRTSIQLEHVVLDAPDEHADREFQVREEMRHSMQPVILDDVPCRRVVRLIQFEHLCRSIVLLAPDELAELRRCRTRYNL
jgi:nitrogenase subunit NifH